MNIQDIYHTERWSRFRVQIWQRDEGKCRICHDLGSDVHHLYYRFGFFNPEAVILVCRPCHLIWQGIDPVHLSDDNPCRRNMFRLAHIVRCLGTDRRWLWRGWRFYDPAWIDDYIAAMINEAAGNEASAQTTPKLETKYVEQ